MGDTTGVDEDDWGGHGNKRLDNWAYKRLMNLIDYKARGRGIELKMFDERGTSSSCSVCEPWMMPVVLNVGLEVRPLWGCRTR